MTRSTLALMFGLLAAAGCRTPTMFRWGDYDEKLYKHYKEPTDRASFVAGLREVIQDAEQSGTKVPPGCYAELGYALHEQGELSEARAYFEKESKAWPESRALMTTMIANVDRAIARRTAPPVVPASTSVQGQGERR